MGFFRSVMGLFRGSAGKDGEKAAAGLLKEQATPVETQPAEPQPVQVQPAEAQPAEVQPAEAQPAEVQPAEAQPAEVQPVEAEVQPVEVQPAEAQPVAAQPEVARRQVKREARPDPNKPGWGLTIGREISKTRGDSAGQELERVRSLGRVIPSRLPPAGPTRGPNVPAFWLHNATKLELSPTAVRVRAAHERCAYVVACAALGTRPVPGLRHVFEVATQGDHQFPANPAPETVLRALMARVMAA
jgi:hypothetical protein